MGGEGAGWFQRPSILLFVLFWNSPLLNGLYPDLGNIAYSGKFSQLDEKKMPN